MVVMLVLSGALYQVLEYSVGWYIFTSLIMRITLELVLRYANYADTKSLENKWNKQSISKLSRGKKIKTWMKVAVSELAVGDLVLLKPNTISPADMLILYTSDKLHSEMIVSVNERKITGMNRVSIKSAICAPPDLFSRIVSSSEDQLSSELADACIILSSPAFVKDVTPKLVGQIEYCSPEDRVSSVLGSFKLKNDPKAIRITDENILYCGSKLLGAEVIGLVLYTGQDTRVFQQNSVQEHEQNKPSRYKTVLICITMSALMGIISAVYKLIQPRTLTVLSMVTGRSQFAVLIITIIDAMIFQLHQGAPLLFLFIVEIVNHSKHSRGFGEKWKDFLQFCSRVYQKCKSKDRSPVIIQKGQEGSGRKDSILQVRKASDPRHKSENFADFLGKSKRDVGRG